MLHNMYDSYHLLFYICREINKSVRENIKEQINDFLIIMDKQMSGFVDRRVPASPRVCVSPPLFIPATSMPTPPFLGHLQTEFTECIRTGKQK